ncbi:Pol Polyprotein [Phytophthora cinnamomi]|uniref:Pol Polyprotein n=1 Tax=Phytophthora cinnamomi TaxID=4785 RepID=UPI0035596B4A|nr:Pol Polyprotein [Phytophthora cinnamomi]
MLTNAQLLAEIDRLNQAMEERTRVPSNLPKFTSKRGEDVREWLFQIENACRINGIQIDDASRGAHVGIFREHVLQHFEASNYQAVLREKLQRLKQTADIETYNGEYSALIFRVEGMSVLDQALCYANGLKPRTRSYVKLEM